MGKIKTMHNLEEYKTEISGNSGKLVVAFFTAAWCPNCKSVLPVLTNLAQQHDIVVVTVDVDALPAAADMEGVLGMPTIKFYKSKLFVAEVQGPDIVKMTSIVTKNS